MAYLSKKYIKIELNSIAHKFYKNCGFKPENITFSTTDQSRQSQPMFKITPPTDDTDIKNTDA